MSPLDVLARGVGHILGRPLEASERESFSKYLDLLVKWNKSQRLIGSSAPVWIVEHLFLDSLLFLRLLPSTLRTLLDLGSGAGLPGLPIKIVRPDAVVTLVESRRRRVSFLSSVTRELRLTGVHVIAERLEEREQDLAGRFDAVVMRCAGGVNELLPIGAGLLKKGGLVIAAGPPRPTPLAIGEWVTVPGWEPGRTRRFALYRAP